MSSVSSVTSYTTSALLSSVSSSDTAGTDSAETTTDSAATTETAADTTTTSDTEAYSVEISSNLIKSAILNTYIPQLLESWQDDTITNAVSYDFYTSLSTSALNYVIDSNTDSSAEESDSTTSTVDISV
ncbi:MAG: hypothetical protein H6Q72_3155 [Firmicutes bacterium]|nr:hypothetical protein [Bacillota bacterium]